MLLVLPPRVLSIVLSILYTVINAAGLQALPQKCLAGRAPTCHRARMMGCSSWYPPVYSALCCRSAMSRPSALPPPMSMPSSPWLNMLSQARGTMLCRPARKASEAACAGRPWSEGGLGFGV